MIRWSFPLSRYGRATLMLSGINFCLAVAMQARPRLIAQVKTQPC